MLKVLANGQRTLAKPGHVRTPRAKVQLHNLKRESHDGFQLPSFPSSGLTRVHHRCVLSTIATKTFFSRHPASFLSRQLHDWQSYEGPVNRCLVPPATCDPRTP